MPTSIPVKKKKKKKISSNEIICDWTQQHKNQ